MVEIHIQQDQHIGRQRYQRVIGREDIGRFSANVLQEQARPPAPKAGVPQGYAQAPRLRIELRIGLRELLRYRLRTSLRRQVRPEEQQNTSKGAQPVQAGAKAFPSESAKRRRDERIIRATRAMATPRITKAAGR